MELNEIKKLLYREKPLAFFDKIENGICYYTSKTVNHKNSTLDFSFIDFEIPVSEMGTTPFFSNMEAKHLIRWIKE